MLGKDVTHSKSEVAAEKEQVWEQLTNEGTSSSSDSDNESSLHLSGSDTEQSGLTDCISGLVSSSTSDNEQDAPSKTEPLEKVAMLPFPPGLVSPTRRNRKAPLAEVLSSKLLEVSAGKPVKVFQHADYKPMKTLDPSVPAKKKPVFKEFAGKEKKLDPTIPAKKHIPSWLLQEAFGENAVTPVTSKPISPKPPKMPLRATQVPQACSVSRSPVFVKP